MSTDTRHGFEDGSFVTFHGVKGMTEVNDQEFKIAVPSQQIYSKIYSIENMIYIKVHLHLQLVIQLNLVSMKVVEQ